MDTDEIDFVIAWVDGADPAWRATYDRFCAQEDKTFNKNGERFRDWGLLRFWFRGVEKYAPWVRRIHFVTCGHVPQWLDINHPKIHFVKHSDYLPSRYLPTFSANPIEINLHRIDGLAEQFVFFNDDIFLSAPVDPTVFFKKGLPRDRGIRNYPARYDIGHIDLNDINLINRRLDFWPLYRKNLWKWYNYRYGAQMLRNLFFVGYKDFTGVKNMHSANAYLKSTYLEVWNSCAEELEVTSLRKFRNIGDVNQWLFKYWQLVTGNFFPQNHNYSRYCLVDDLRTIERVLTRKETKTICINDNGKADILQLKQAILQVFAKVFPEKSGFELY